MNRLPITVKIWCLTSILLLLAGCSQLNTQDEYPQSSGQNQAPVVSASPDYDVLLDFSLKVSNMAVAGRAELCRSLLKRQKETPSTEISVQLLIGRLFSESCGDISKILDAVASVSSTNQYDEHSQKLIVIYAEILKRMQNSSKKLVALERKQKSLQALLDSKGNKNPQGSSNDSRLLRDKLDAIRNMEKQLDETSDSN
ncbi:hypothetical protein [Methylomonas sp. AM2-LC]|uniref:hypothetical protein n=1 Tax=Methylomonas sp. AM2-LC TaxID=3153301 RepID=UPI003267AB96